MQRSNTQGKIEALARERERIKISIDQLKEKLSKRRDNLRLSHKGTNDFESRASQSVSKRNENPSVLAKKLKISEWINKVVYSNDEINFLDDGSSQYIADGASGLVAFQIQFVVKDMESKEMIIHSLKVAYRDPFHEAELKTFSNMCMRQNSLQKLVRGIVSYAELFANREEIIGWLIEENEPHFSVHKIHEDAAYNIRAEGRTSLHFSCEWKIIWNEGSLTMRPSFTIRANNKSIFYKENEYLFKKLVSPSIIPEQTTELWKQLAKVVILENELAVHVIKKKNVSL